MTAISSPNARAHLSATLFAFFAISFAMLLAGAAAGAQPSASESPAGVPQITVSDSDLAPSLVRTTEDHAFVLHNDSAGIMRVEFKIRPGSGIACSLHSRTPRLARKFVVGVDEQLVCHAKPGEYEFTAYRVIRIASGQLKLTRSRGRVLVS
jgi:hypothetical protein